MSAPGEWRRKFDAPEDGDAGGDGEGGPARREKEPIDAEERARLELLAARNRATEIRREQLLAEQRARFAEGTFLGWRVLPFGGVCPVSGAPN